MRKAQHRADKGHNYQQSPYDGRYSGIEHRSVQQRGPALQTRNICLEVCRRDCAEKKCRRRDAADDTGQLIERRRQRSKNYPRSIPGLRARYCALMRCSVMQQAPEPAPSRVPRGDSKSNFRADARLNSMSRHRWRPHCQPWLSRVAF